MAFISAQSIPNRFLAHYLSRLEQQKKGLQRIRDILPPSLARHALHCVIAEKKLLLYTDSAAWGSQLRFYKNAILAAVDGNTTEILQIRILTENALPHKIEHGKPNIPSSENIAMIRNHSTTMSDSELKLALQKLCATLSRK